MHISKTKTLTSQQFQQINSLWNEEYPLKLNNRFGLLLEGIDYYNHYLIEDTHEVLAWAVEFEKEAEKRFSIIVKKSHQGKGLGRRLLDRLKNDVGEFYGWVIDHNTDLKQNGEFYISPIDFYLKNGFEILENERIDIDILQAVKIKKKAKIFAETDQFILRELLPADREGMFELDSDPEVHKYLGNKPVLQKEKISEIISFIRQQYVDYGIGRWAIIDKNTQEFIGWAGLKFVTDLTNQHQNFYDIGYRLKRKYWGQGIATKAAEIALDYAFSTLNLEEVYATASCENNGSNKILQKIGMNLMETFYYGDIKCNWYHLKRKAYENLKRNP
jgi:[ribosomal protein S5]-alanine N-acetyltransferase